MTTIYHRTEMLIGTDAMAALRQAHVAIAGIGGVGSYVVEALARAGVGKLTLVDHDTIDITNLNRQIHALQSTVGQPKVEAMAQRVHDINPDIEVITHQQMLLEDNFEEIFSGQYDYLVDAIDMVTAKVNMVLFAQERNIPIICSMGTANKLDNTGFVITDISKTHTCPLARVMRKALKDRGITKGVEVLYSTVPALKVQGETEEGKRIPPASISYVPATAGLLLAGHIIQQIIEKNSVKKL
ncbi:MAG: tRNA threonylcarbamoyladenosine dehydratase [Peptococcaceae bacterium]|nr:tRNA threonylcarbamoyladenosine dehydratase [Peptococcaceae bacterium]